jgi:hypothetical protein
VSVLSTSDAALIALAKSLLEGQGIDYVVRGEGLQDLLGIGRIPYFNVVVGPAEFLVRKDDADRTRDLLQDLTMADPHPASSHDALTSSNSPAGFDQRGLETPRLPRRSPSGAAEATEAQPSTYTHGNTIDIFDAATNERLGSITETDLQVLADVLEEESAHDRDYYIDGPTIDLIANTKGTDGLMQMLRKALDSAEGIEIRWERRAASPPSG